ncbi:hypothetical protein [Cryptosporangium phraense]|uniref:Uncharacterized protein n=1 Tax=Cryptosporangium phraense TaxID=2593070 RepID=A0A545ATC9_9ACTN|nr:hypothetical protein [Cryptosporangium phraense]TQS44573.1 hypothetical protein FL583_14055 [Cryptosporangium phraense]
MLIDCDACGVRGSGCADCVISALVGGPPPGVELTALPAGVRLDEEENVALLAFAAGGFEPEFLAITAAEPGHEDGWLGARRDAESRGGRRAG